MLPLHSIRLHGLEVNNFVNHRSPLHTAEFRNAFGIIDIPIIAIRVLIYYVPTVIHSSMKSVPDNFTVVSALLNETHCLLQSISRIVALNDSLMNLHMYVEQNLVVTTLLI